MAILVTNLNISLIWPAYLQVLCSGLVSNGCGKFFHVGKAQPFFLHYVDKHFTETLRLHPFLNFFFFSAYALTAYFYFLAMTADPGYVLKSKSRSEQKVVVQDLIDAGRFDEPNFCINCMVRKPLRSKHCRRCNRCIAKQDQ